MEPRVFRPGCLILVFALGFTLIPLVFILPGLYGLLTGAPIPFSSDDGRSHPGTTGELLLITLFPMIHLAVGIAVLMYWLNARLYVSEEGIRGTDWRGRTSFEATWKELTHTQHKVDGDGDSSYYLYAGDQKLQLMDREAYDHVLEEVKWRCPHVGQLN